MIIPVPETEPALKYGIAEPAPLICTPNVPLSAV
ncbi:hypothetical protein MEZE111188_21515 [Mesobacillus zeae]